MLTLQWRIFVIGLISFHGLILMQSAIGGTVRLTGRGLLKIPKNVHNKSKVTTLSLINNRISRLEECDFCEYTSLDYLTVFYNQINFVHGSAFNHTPLRKLSLSLNSLQCVPDLSSIRHTLEILLIKNNHLNNCRKFERRQNAKRAVTFPRLRSIDLRDNRLFYLPYVVRSAVNLKCIELKGNKLHCYSYASILHHRTVTIHADANNCSGTFEAL